MFFQHFVNTADPTGRYVILCRANIWTVCDLVERQVIRSFEYGDSRGLGLGEWCADVAKQRAYLTTLRDKVECYSLKDGCKLWERTSKHAQMCINHRTGSLLINDHRVAHIDPDTGKKDRLLVAPEDTRFAGTHPDIPVTLYCRFERIPGPGESWRWPTHNVFEFFHEDTGDRVTNPCGWKQTPFKAFFHDQDCYVQEIGGVIHKLNIHTGEQAWVTSLAGRGNSMTVGGYHKGQKCLVMHVMVGDAILFMEPDTGKTIKQQSIPTSWGKHRGLNCLVDNNTKVLLMDGRMFDVATMECVEEGVFASMGLVFGPPVE